MKYAVIRYKVTETVVLSMESPCDKAKEIVDTLTEMGYAILSTVFMYK